MSIKLMSIVWEVPFPTATQMLVCLKLADYANDDGSSIFPANQTLASKARCSESTVKVTIKALRSCGLLCLVKQGGSGPRDTNEWRLNVEMLRALSNGSATMSGRSDLIEVDGYAAPPEVENKGSEKGSNSDPLELVRGQSGELRGQPTGAKGSAGKPQPVKNLQLDSSGARARASEKSAHTFRANEQQQPSQVITQAESPDEFSAWLEWHRKHSMPPAVRLIEKTRMLMAPTMWPPNPEVIAKNRAVGVDQ